MIGQDGDLAYFLKNGTIAFMNDLGALGSLEMQRKGS